VDHSEDIGIGANFILKWIIMKEGGRVWTGSGYRQMAGCQEDSNGLLGVIECG
jgi:hypothetical protein